RPGRSVPDRHGREPRRPRSVRPEPATRYRRAAARHGRGALIAIDDLGERLAAHDRLGGLGDDVGARAGGVIFALDQEPLRLLPRPRALKGEAALELLAMEDEDRVAAFD